MSKPEILESLFHGLGNSKASSPEQGPISENKAEAQPQAKPKRYKAPQPDADTFDSRQEFLDSLRPLDSDHVDNDRRRCPICWKPIGEEADPGFDNSEFPVKLRCSHVFGHKCLEKTFAPPNTTKLRLQPLSFAPGRKGSLLGHRLHTYTNEHGISPSEVVETFHRMLNESCQPQKGVEVFGKHWWPIMQDVLHFSRKLSNVVLMENATILDMDPHSLHEASTPAYSSIQPENLSISNIDLDKTLTQATELHFTSLLEDEISIPPNQVTPTVPIMVGGFSTFPAPAPPFELFPHYPHYQHSLGTGGPAGSSTWEAVLAAPTNLDKLTALQASKKKEQEDKQGDKNVTKADPPLDEVATMSALAEAQADKMRLIHEVHMLQRRGTMRLLAHTLADVWANYKNASTSQTHDLTTDDTCPRTVRMSMSFHEEDLNKTSYQIQHAPYFSSYDNDSDSEEEEDLEKCSLMITRSFCSSCWAVGSEKNLPLLKELTWKDNKKTPDSCPLCHKVLFRTRATRFKGS